MYNKPYILLSISQRDARPTNTSGMTVEDCIKKARRQINGKLARPVAIVARYGEGTRYGEVMMEQHAIEQCVKSLNAGATLHLSKELTRYDQKGGSK